MATVTNPYVRGTIKDGGLKIQPPNADGETIVVGISSSGVAGTTYSYAGSETNSVVSELGVGDGVDAVTKQLVESEGRTTRFRKTAPSTAGTAGSVVNVGGGPVITLTGTPNVGANVIIAIQTGGTIGTSTFRFSLDGGDTYSAVYSTASTFLLPHGVTANLAAGTYVAGATYTWTDTGPKMTSANISDAMDDIIAGVYTPAIVRIAGIPANDADLVTIATMLKSKQLVARARGKFFMIIVSGPESSVATTATQVAALDEWGITIAAGFAEISNSTTGAIEKKSAADVIAPRAARNPVSVQLIRTKADDRPEAFGSVVRLVPAGAAASTGYHDEAATPVGALGRLTVLTSVVGQPGFYVNRAFTMAANGSDFQDFSNAMVMLKAARLFQFYQFRNLGVRIFTNPTTGFISRAQRGAIEQEASEFLAVGLAQDIPSAANVKVYINPSENILSTGVFKAKFSIVPFAYAHAIEWEGSFVLNF